MPLIAKFIVANEENAYKVSEMAKEHYAFSRIKETGNDNSVSSFLNKANSFTTEWLMSFDVTGEDEERQEEPLALVVMVSANMPQEATGNKPVYIEKVIPHKEDEGTLKVLNRVLEIAEQRKHDIIWAEAPYNDKAAIKAYEALGFKEAGKRGEALLFKKSI
jgi:hypothetical protein